MEETAQRPTTRQRSITFPAAMLAQIEALAAARRVTVPTVVRWACEAYLTRESAPAAATPEQ